MKLAVQKTFLGPKIWYKKAVRTFVPNLGRDELHIILNLRNWEVGEHSSFFKLLTKLFFKSTMKFQNCKIIQNVIKNGVNVFFQLKKVLMKSIGKVSHFRKIFLLIKIKKIKRKKETRRETVCSILIDRTEMSLILMRNEAHRYFEKNKIFD